MPQDRDTYQCTSFRIHQLSVA